MKYILFIIISIFLVGCINKKGISMNYYDNCHPYYDLYGVYHEECPDNIINFKKEENKQCLNCN